MRQRLPGRSIGLPAVLLVAFLHGLFYVVTLPAWDLFDEQPHLGYALALRDTHRLPVLQDPLPDAIVLSGNATRRWVPFQLPGPVAYPRPPDGGIAYQQYEAQQPPLYYVLIAPLTLAGGGDALQEMYAARMLGPFLLVAFAATTWALARRWFPRDGPATWTCAALTVAVVPAVAEAAGRVSNDLLTAVLGTVALLATSRLADGPSRGRALQLGVAVAAAFLTKEVGAVLLAPALVVLVLLARRRQLTPVIAIAALAPVAVAGALWASWNEWHYGVLEGSAAFIAFSGIRQRFPLREFLGDLWQAPWTSYSYWRTADPGVVAATSWVLAALLGVAVVGLALRWRTARLLPLLLGGVTVTALIASSAQASRLGLAAPIARYLLIAYPPVAIVTVAGWAGLRHRALAAVPAAAASVLSALLLVRWYVPFFGPYFAVLHT